MEVTSVELSAQTVLLYGPDEIVPGLFRVTGRPRVMTAADLSELSYPNPGGAAYYCFEIAGLDAPESLLSLDSNTVRMIHRELLAGRDFGTPVGVTWLNFASAVAAIVADPSSLAEGK